MIVEHAIRRVSAFPAELTPTEPSTIQQTDAYLMMAITMMVQATLPHLVQSTARLASDPTAVV